MKKLLLVLVLGLCLGASSALAVELQGDVRMSAALMKSIVERFVELREELEAANEQVKNQLDKIDEMQKKIDRLQVSKNCV